MASKTDICNLALSHLGVGKDVSNPDTEKSNEARAFNRFYVPAVEATIRDFPWPFSKRMAPLGLVSDNTVLTDVRSQWAYSYRYPTDCLDIRRIMSARATDTVQSRISYQIMGDDVGSLIITNLPSAFIEYSARVTNTNAFPPDFTLALSFRLASYMATRLSAGDPFKVGQAAIQRYQMELSRAAANAANEDQPDREAEAEMIRARDGGSDHVGWGRGYLGGSG